MSNDAAVVALMDHLNEVDKRRRLMVMQQKEVEAKLQHASQEQKEIERRRGEMLETEAQLHRDLDALADQQKQVQLQLLVETDRVRRCEVEEPLLQKHAAEQLAKLNGESEVWKSNLSRLEVLASAWQDDPCMREAHQSIREADNDIERMKAEHAAAERTTASARARIAQLRETAKNNMTVSITPNEGGAISLNFSDAAAVLGEVAANDACAAVARDRLAQEAEQWRQQEANLMRQTAAVQREVDDLAARTEELEGMLSDVEETTKQLTSSLMELNACVAANLCSGCRASGDG